MPDNQYIAIRAYIETIKTYTASETLYYRKSSETYHSFTNPVWIKTGSFNKLPFQIVNNIRIYPNPASDVCYIEGIDLHEIISISAIATNGIIYNFPLQTNRENLVLNISMLTKGIYTVKLICNHGTVVKKLVKM